MKLYSKATRAAGLMIAILVLGITACDPGLVGTESDPATGSPAAETPVTEAPATPAGLAVGTATEASLALSWASVVGASTYELYRDTSAGGSFSTKVYDGANIGQTDTGLSSTSTYYYKVLAKNSAGSSALSAVVSGTTFGPSASLDLSFGSGGKVVTPIGSAGDEVYSMVIQSDGKIVVAGLSASGDYDFALARYDTDGSLDTNFGSSGKVITDISASGYPDAGYAMALDGSGNLVVAGYVNTASNGLDFALARYTSGGSLDTTFNSDGIVTTDFSSASADVGNAVAIGSDGTIVVAGRRGNNSAADFAIARYTSTGSLDMSFNDDGLVTTAIGSGLDEVYGVAIQSDGKIVVVGTSDSGTSPNVNYDIALVRYNTDGSLDTLFGGGDGIVLWHGDVSQDEGYAVTILGTGEILVAGYAAMSTGGQDFALLRFTSAGVLDTGFGDGDGMVTTPVGGSHDIGQSIALQSDGKILVGGRSYNGSNNDFALVRYNADGSLDTDFDDDGVVSSAFGTSSDDTGRAVAVQGDGRIVVAGYSDTDGTKDFALLRYNP